MPLHFDDAVEQGYMTAIIRCWFGHDIAPSLGPLKSKELAVLQCDTTFHYAKAVFQALRECDTTFCFANKGKNSVLRYLDTLPE